MFAVKNRFLLLKSSTLKHMYTLAKQISCEIYTPLEEEGSRNGKFTISKLKSPRLSEILDETMSFVMDKSKS